MNEPTEAEVRALRDAIYGPGSDNNWDNCKEAWMRPENIAWLRANQPRGKRSKQP